MSFLQSQQSIDYLVVYVFEPLIIGLFCHDPLKRDQIDWDWRVRLNCIPNAIGCTIQCMGWLQLVGSIKLQVSFANEPYKKDDILQKRPIILSILLTVATLYLWVYCMSLFERALYTLHESPERYVECRAFDVSEYHLFYRTLLQKRPSVLYVSLWKSPIYSTQEPWKIRQL